MINYSFYGKEELLGCVIEECTTHGVDEHVQCERRTAYVNVTPKNADAAGFVAHLAGKFCAFGGTVVSHRVYGTIDPASWTWPGDVWQ